MFFVLPSMSLSKFLNCSILDSDFIPPHELWLRKSTGLVTLGIQGNLNKKSNSVGSSCLSVSSTYNVHVHVLKYTYSTCTLLLHVLYCVYMYTCTCSHLECYLGCEYQFVSLKQASGGIHKHRVSDAINQLVHAYFNIIRWLRFLNSFMKHDIECLQK